MQGTNQKVTVTVEIPGRKAWLHAMVYVLQGLFFDMHGVVPLLTWQPEEDRMIKSSYKAAT